MQGSWVRNHRGVLAAIVAVGTTTALAGVSAAGASEEAAPVTVYALDNGGPCFTARDATTCEPSETAAVAINTGESVTWDFSRVDASHNAAAANDVPADPTWKDYHGEFVSEGSYARPFNQPGTYQFRCDAHPNMTGTITVTGEPIETTTPSPSPTTTATPTPTPTTQPGGGQPITPPPTGGDVDRIKPTVQSLRMKRRKRAVRVTFTLSENATVTIRVKRGRKVVKKVTKQVAAGRRTITVRSPKLRKGRYKVEVRARDASGNRSSLVSKSLRLRK